MTTLQFIAKVVSPAEVPGMSCQHDPANAFRMTLPGLTADFDRVISGPGFGIGSEASYVPFPSARAFAHLDFLALAVREGSAPVELLLGRAPDVWGQDAAWPLAGGEGFAFDLYDAERRAATVVTVDVTFTSSATSLVKAIEEINARATLLGLPAVAFVAPNGELLLRGPQPGGTMALEITEPLAALGFPAPTLRLGRGEPLTVKALAVLSPDVAGDELWLRGGPAALDFVLAGT